MAAPVERKVQASTGVAAVSGLVLWVLGKYVFKGSVPDVIVSWVYVLVPGVLTFAAGYLARHTPRPDQPPPPLPARYPPCGARRGAVFFMSGLNRGDSRSTPDVG